MITAAEQFQSSELSRNSLRVFDAAEKAPIRVTRRDGEHLVLMTEREADARRELLNLAAQLIAVTTDDRGTLAERMANIFPWMHALSPEGQVQCSHDLVNSARASFATEQAHLAIAELTAWRETAFALASGLGQTPVEWLDDAMAVAQPAAHTQIKPNRS